MSNFSERVREMLGKQEAAPFARNAGLSPGTFHSTLQGAEPKVGAGVKIARALGTSVEFLVTGEDAGALAGFDDRVWVSLPEFDVRQLDDEGDPTKVGHALFRRDELARFGSLDRLWAARMPSSAQLDIAQEGDTIICAGAELPLVEGAAYLFRLRRSTLVRRFTLTGNDWVFGDDGHIGLKIATDAGERQLDLVPLGRVLATINYRPA